MVRACRVPAVNTSVVRRIGIPRANTGSRGGLIRLILTICCNMSVKAPAARPYPLSMTYNSARGGRPSLPNTHSSVIPRQPKSVVLRTNGALLLDDEPEWFTVGVLENIMIVIWRGQANAEVLARLTKMVDWLDLQYPQGRSAVHVVLSSAQLPTAEAQRALVELLKHSQPVCVAAVFMGTGFRASAQRSATTQVTMQANQAFEFRQHQNIEDIAGWLPEKHHAKTGVRVRGERLVAVTTAFAAA